MRTRKAAGTAENHANTQKCSATYSKFIKGYRGIKKQGSVMSRDNLVFDLSMSQNVKSNIADRLSVDAFMLVFYH